METNEHGQKNYRHSDKCWKSAGSQAFSLGTSGKSQIMAIQRISCCQAPFFRHFIPQHAPENLAHRGGGQAFPEFNGFGAFVSSQLVLAEFHDFRLGYGFSGQKLDKGLDRFTAAGIGYADHGHVRNFGMGVEDFLDFPGIAVKSADQDQILFPVRDDDVAFRINMADIAGQKKSSFLRFPGKQPNFQGVYSSSRP